MEESVALVAVLLCILIAAAISQAHPGDDHHLAHGLYCFWG